MDRFARTMVILALLGMVAATVVVFTLEAKQTTSTTKATPQEEVKDPPTPQPDLSPLSESDILTGQNYLLKLQLLQEQANKIAGPLGQLTEKIMRSRNIKAPEYEVDYEAGRVCKTVGQYNGSCSN